jgi:toxin HigB-1
MIKSFADKYTEALFEEGICHRSWRMIEKAALRKLDQLNNVTGIFDLAVPPGNRLERLRGDRDGQWSIRINDQYRLCFRWQGDDAFDVCIVDYR